MTRNPFEGQPVLRNDGGPCPVPLETMLRVHFANGGASISHAGNWDWGETGDCAIVGFQIARTEPKPRKWSDWQAYEPWNKLSDLMSSRRRFEVKRTKSGLKIRYRMEK